MKSSKRGEFRWVGALYITLILVFGFIYFVYYRTERRVAWYTEMYVQSENAIKEIRDILGIK